MSYDLIVSRKEAAPTPRTDHAFVGVVGCAVPGSPTKTLANDNLT
jgi:hypothetical protein